MKKTILLTIILLLLTIPMTASAFHAGSSSSFSIGFSGSSGGAFHYSQQSYNNSVNYQRTVINHGSRYYGYRPPVINGYGHIHRQEGRRYINDYPCAPVVVVPARHHHYNGCGCR